MQMNIRVYTCCICGHPPYLVLCPIFVYNEDGRIDGQQYLNMSTQGELWRYDGPAMRWSVNARVCQLLYLWLVKVCHCNQLEASCKGHQSSTPNLHLDDSVVFSLLFTGIKPNGYRAICSSVCVAEERDVIQSMAARAKNV